MSNEKERALAERYAIAMHRVQTAIAMKMGFGDANSSTSPKQMRVGIDMSKADTKGLADLLISKGVFTLGEYLEAVTKSAEEEADFQEAELSQQMGAPVKTF